MNFREALATVPFKQTPLRSWRPSPRPLENIRDEYARGLPANCRFSKPGKVYYGVYQQTVIRRREGEKVIYRYDSSIVAEYLSKGDATQASVLLVHEWLWDFYEGLPRGAPRIRRANLFLHSIAAESATRDEFIREVFHARE